MSRISQSTLQMKLYYWTQENARSEIDFLLQTMGQIVPVEVKAEENLQSKSLRTYFQKYTPGAAIRTSMSDFRKDEWLVNLPLYAISELQAVEIGRAHV